jgi:hypothetical protein
LEKVKIMDNGFCLIYRFGSDVDLNKYIAELKVLDVSIKLSNEEDGLLQQFDVSSKSFRKVDLQMLEDQFRGTGSCSFLLWSNGNNINVIISSPRKNVISEYYDIEMLDQEQKQRFVEQQIVRFAGYDSLARIAIVGSFRGDVEEDDWDYLMLDKFEVPEEEPDIIAVNKGEEKKILNSIKIRDFNELGGVVQLRI